jgi:CTP:molybdopterin cytidylyltransferase MocA
MKPTLLVLAAGMGSRYGGLKQIDPVGPNSELIIDYSLHDAIEAGFGKVLTTDESWFGVTYKQDKIKAQQSIKGLIQKGVYPERLWS